MFRSPTMDQNKSQNSERRSGRREPLEWVVLVYFGQDNWGKLVDLSESGMRIEFAQPPSGRERIHFTFEAMGRVPASFGGEMVSDSFAAAGDVRWTRDFERTAGVQFVTLPEESREQIRKWLSFEASTVTASANTKTEPEAPVPLEEPPEPLPAPPETLPILYENESQRDLQRVKSGREPLVDPNSPLVGKILEAPSFQNYSGIMAEKEKKQAETSGTNPRMSRTQVLSVTAGLALVLVIGGIRMILPQLTPRVPAAERIASPNGGERETLGAEYGAAAGSQRPFLVEVLDAYNRRWLLWFDDQSSKKGRTQAAYRSKLPPSTDPQRGADHAKQPADSPKPPALHQFTLIAPKPARPEWSTSLANPPSLAAPVVRDELHAPLEAPIASILTPHAIPAPVPGPSSVGGQVQAARLLKYVPPMYPPFARSSHVEGEVLLDALIDSNGDVTELKVLAGPPILQQAAMDAARQWKYDPARLDGRPVTIHLSLTVRFHFH